MTKDRRIERYDDAYERMLALDTPIPPDVLTGYMQAMRDARQAITGPYYAKVLVITGQYLGSHLDTAKHVFKDAIKEGFIIRSSGQKWPE